MRFEICRVYLKCSCIREDVREFGRRGGVRESIMRACESLDVSVMTNRGCLRQHRHEEERGLVAPFWCVSICHDVREVFLIQRCVAALTFARIANSLPQRTSCVP